MAAFVQSTGTFATTSATNIARAYTSNVVAGNLLVACCMCIITAASTFSVADTQVNTWAAATVQSANGVYKGQIFITRAGSSAANTVTFTRSGAASTDERIIIIAEFSPAGGNTWPASPVDGANTGSGATANPTINVTVAAAATLLVGTLPTSATATAGAGFSDLGGQDGNDAEYKLAPGSGSIAVPFVDAASTWSEAAASFLEAAAATAAARLTTAPYQGAF